MQNKLKFLIISIMFISIIGIVSAANSTTAFCAPGVENINIITLSDEFGVGKEIGDVNLNITSNIGNQLPYRALLLDAQTNNTEIFGAARPTGVMSGGVAVINFNYIPTKTGKLTIEVSVCLDKTKTVSNCPLNQKVSERKTIDIKRNFKLNLYCPITNYINQKVTCSWEPKDVENPTTVLNINPPIASVSQGAVSILAPISGNSLSFTPTVEGSLTVRLESSADGYVKVIESQQVFVDPVTFNRDFFIDNKDIKTLSSSGIDVGSKTLSFTIKEGTLNADVRAIQATITTPSGQEIPVNFIKKTNEWSATYNFEQAGQKYILKGQILFTDPDKESNQFNYDILTLSAVNEKTKSNFNSIIIFVSIFIIVIIIIFGVILLKTRKKRK